MDLITAYSKRRDLADALVSTVQQLRQAQTQTGEPVLSLRSDLNHRPWRVDDRLNEADTEQLIAAFTSGTSKRKLAERYGISESSVKRLIRQYGASKPSSGLSQRPPRWRHQPSLLARRSERVLNELLNTVLSLDLRIMGSSVSIG